jgi:elongation factor G
MRMNSGLNRLHYRETIQGSGAGEGKVIRRRGGVGVYANVRVAVRALKQDEGTAFIWNAGSAMPADFAPAIFEGIRNVLNAGVLAGLEITGIHITVEDGSYHEVDSTADAFREAAEIAAAEAIRKAGPIVLEAISMVTVTVPDQFSETVELTLASRGVRAKVLPSENPSRTYTATLPAAIVAELISELLRATSGSAQISSCSAGFRPRPDPPDTIEQWVASS